MEKKEVELDPEYDVPPCYVKFFNKKTPPPQSPAPDSGLDSDPKPQKNQKLPVITIQTTKEKNKDCTVATIPNSIKLSDADLKKFTSYLQKRFNSRANYKKNPLKIIISGTKPDELKDEIQSFFKLDNVEFEFSLSKIKVKENFQVFLMPIDDGVEVSWKQHGSPKNLEDDFEKLVRDSWEAPITNNSTHKEARFTINGILSDAVKDYFMNKYTMQDKQILTINSEHKEPNYNPEFVIDCKKPLKQIERFDNGKKTYFSELTSTIFDLLTAQQNRYGQKKFNNNLKFSRIGPDKNGKIKWTTIINPRKKFSKSSILNSHSLNIGDKAIVTYQDNKTIRGFITEIDQETALITAKFLLSSNEKPPGFDEELPETHNKDSSDYDDDDEEETNDVENVNYKKFLAENNIVIHDDKDEEEEIVDEEKEENRINEIVEQTQKELNDDKNDEEEDFYDDNYIENDDGLYTIYFEKSEAFFEKCAKALLCLYDSHSEIRNVITKNDRYDDQNKTDKTISLQDASINLTDSPFLTNQQKKDQDYLKKLQITPSREQKKSIEMILSNKISVVHGPPGTGKTFSLSLFVYHLLTRLKEDEKR